MPKICPECNKRFSPSDRLCPDCKVTLVVVSESNSIIGKIIDDRFSITDIIGSGGMGSVYKAKQLSIDRDIALKVLRPEFAKDVQLIKRFMREAKATSKLDHPNIITVHDFGQTDDGLLYIAMEYLNGRPLTSIIRDQGTIHFERTIRIAVQICSALSEAHKKDIIHRDLKPDNIFIIEKADNPDFVKVLDFGIAKIFSDDIHEDLTRTGQVFGTPHYMSPEQARGSKLDARSDIFSLGVIIYEMLSGQRPFDAESPTGVLLKVLSDPVTPIKEINPAVTVPEKLETIIAKMLNKETQNRPSGSAEVKEALLSAAGSSVYQTGTGFEDSSSKRETLMMYDNKWKPSPVTSFVHKETVQAPVNIMEKTASFEAEEEESAPTVIFKKEEALKKPETVQAEKLEQIKPQKKHQAGDSGELPTDAEMFSPPVRTVKWLLIPVSVIVFILIGLGVYYFVQKEEKSESPAANAAKPSAGISMPSDKQTLKETSMPEKTTETAAKDNPPKAEDVKPAVIAKEPPVSEKEFKSITISTEPQSAEIFVNEKPYGKSPSDLKFFRDDRKITVKIKSSGYKTAENVVEYEKVKDRESINIKLEKEIIKKPAPKKKEKKADEDMVL